MWKDKLDLEAVVSNLIEEYKICLNNYQKLFKLTKQQQEEITNEEYNQLEVLINKKEEVINRIKQEQREIKILQKQLANKFNIINDESFIQRLLNEDIPYKSRLKNIGNKIKKVVTKLEGVDKQNQKLLQEGKKSLQEKIKQLNESQKVFNSYNSNQKNREGKFFDNKG